MSTTTVQLAPVPLFPDCGPVEKITARLSPSTPLVPLAKDDSLNAEANQQRTFVVDLTPDVVQSSPQEKERKEGAPFSGEQTSGFGDAPSSPQEIHPLGHPSVDVHVAKPPAPEPGESDSESVHSPIDPPGLGEESSSLVPESTGEPAPAEVHVEVVDVPALPPAAEAPEEPDAIFSIDPRVFEWELAYDVSDPIFHIELPLFDPDLSSYSLTGLSPLDTFIPDDLFPDDLFVHDISNITRLHPENTNEKSPLRHMPVRYMRIYPKTSREQGKSQDTYDARGTSKLARFAHLYLRSENRMGSGHHSYVYRAPLRLRLNPDTREWSTVTVAAKTANRECGAHLMLDKEAIAYNAFPRELMEDTLGVPAAQNDSSSTDEATSEPSSDAAAMQKSTGESTPMSDSHDANCLGPPLQPAIPAESPASESRAGEWEPAVVPKFYGYYGAVNADGSLQKERHEYCDIDDECTVDWPTRILLLEECGKPVSPHSLARTERYVSHPASSPILS